MKVEFFNGSTKIGEATQQPYTFSWFVSSAGQYTLTAKATDNELATTISSAINVTVTSSGGIGDVTATGEPRVTIIRNVINPLRQQPAALDLTLDKESLSTVKVYNRTGQLIEDVGNRTLTAGTHRIQWMGEKDIAAGIYVMVIDLESTQGKKTFKEKFVLVK